MPSRSERVRASAHEFSRAGRIVEQSAALADGSRHSRSMFGRIGLAVSAAKLGTQAVRLGVTVVRRHPVLGTLLIAGIVLAFAASRERDPTSIH